MKRMMPALALANGLMAWPRQGEVCVIEASHGEVSMTESDGRQVKAHCLSDCEAAPPKGDIKAVFERDQVTLIWPVNRDETKAAVYEVKEAESLSDARRHDRLERISENGRAPEYVGWRDVRIRQIANEGV